MVSKHTHENNITAILLNLKPQESWTFDLQDLECSLRNLLSLLKNSDTSSSIIDDEQVRKSLALILAHLPADDRYKFFKELSDIEKESENVLIEKIITTEDDSIFKDSSETIIDFFQELNKRDLIDRIFSIERIERVAGAISD